MTFPSVTSITESAFPTAATTHAVDMPATVAAGDLLLMFFTCFGPNSITTPTDWTQIYKKVDGSGAGACYAKDAVGDEDGTTVDVVVGSSVRATAQVYRIAASSWFGDLAGVEAGTAVSSSSSTPDPPSVTASWGSADNLFIESAHYQDDDATVSSYSTNYSNGTRTACGSATANTNATTATARRELASDTDDPGTITLSQSEGWTSNTVVIRPAAAATVGIRPMTTFFYKRRYGVGTTLTFPLFDPSTGQAVTGAVHASGDMVLTKDEGTPATFTGGFTDEGSFYSCAPAFGDVQCKRAVFEVIDQTNPKAWLDTFLIVETEGDELSQHNRPPGVLLETTINVVTDAANFTITTGPNDNNALLNSVAFVLDASTPDSPPDRSFRNVVAYTGSTLAVQLESNLVFTPANGDKIIFMPAALVASAADIADAILDELLSGHTTAGTAGKALSDIDTGVAANAAAIGTVDDNLADVSSQIAGVPATAARLLLPQQNQTFANIEFYMADSSNPTAAKTGLSVTVTRSLNGGAFSAGTGTVTEVSNGIYQYDASAADMNAAMVTFKFAAAGAITAFTSFRTTP